MTSLKFKLKKLSILPRFYFHDALEPRELKTNFQTNFRFKRVLGFVIEYSWISKLLRDAGFTRRPRELSCRLYFGIDCQTTLQVQEKFISRLPLKFMYSYVVLVVSRYWTAPSCPDAGQCRSTAKILISRWKQGKKVKLSFVILRTK